MNKTLAAIALGAITATQAQARCDNEFTMLGPKTDESASLAACFANEAQAGLAGEAAFEAFVTCAAQETGVDAETILAMDDQEFGNFMNENFNMWTFEHEMECHLNKFQADPSYSPLSTLD